jgi:hypothetical protein
VPTKKGTKKKATVTKRAPLSPTALAEAEARAGAAEAELLAMLELEENQGGKPPDKSRRSAH